MEFQKLSVFYIVGLVETSVCVLSCFRLFGTPWPAAC